MNNINVNTNLDGGGSIENIAGNNYGNLPVPHPSPIRDGKMVWRELYRTDSFSPGPVTSHFVTIYGSYVDDITGIPVRTGSITAFHSDH